MPCGLTAAELATIKSRAAKGVPRPVSAAIVLSAKGRETFGPSFDFYFK
jgi:hypothetical protein